MKLLLDASAYVGFKLGHAELVEYLARAHTVFMSPVALGELLFGFRNGSRFQVTRFRSGFLDAYIKLLFP